MAKQVTIEITQEMIAASRKGANDVTKATGWRCPIEKALDIAVPDSRYMVGGEHIYTRDFKSSVALSAKAKAFVDAFDTEAVADPEPTKLRITLP